MPRHIVAGLVALAAAPLIAAFAPAECPGSDYPTAARSDYVFACMAAQGGTQQALQRCSCSIDIIGSILPYADYEKAETVLRMRRLGGGYLAETFRSREADDFVSQLREAQAEADVRCFE